MLRTSLSVRRSGGGGGKFTICCGMDELTEARDFLTLVLILTSSLLFISELPLKCFTIEMAVWWSYVWMKPNLFPLMSLFLGRIISLTACCLWKKLHMSLEFAESGMLRMKIDDSEYAAFDLKWLYLGWCPYWCVESTRNYYKYVKKLLYLIFYLLGIIL